MDWAQMRERCPSARFVDIAVLPEHRLAFTRRSEARGCGVADAVADNHHIVWGVVYELDDVDLGRLDAREGFRPGRAINAYRREERHVLAGGDQERPLAAWVYFAEPQQNPPLPSPEYRQLILSGARHWHLPADYVRGLEAIEVRD